MSDALLLVAAALAGYLVGSVPWGLLLLRLSGGPDPRTVGSGNIGATNVTRAGGRALGIATLLLDAAKGFVPALVAAHEDPRAGAIAGLAAILGHCFPVFLRFSGGKGVATFLGASLALAFPVAPLAFGLAWVLLAALTRMVSVASVGGCMAAALACLVMSAGAGQSPPDALGGHAWVGLALLLAAILVAMRHRANLARIRRGAEPRLGKGKNA